MPQDWTILPRQSTGGRGAGPGPVTGGAPTPPPPDWTVTPKQPEKPNPVNEVLDPILDAWNPITMAKGIVDMVHGNLDPRFRAKQVEAVASHIAKGVQQGVDTLKAGQGNPLTRVATATAQMASGLPIVGPQAQAALEGNVPRLVGEQLAVGSQFIAPELLPGTKTLGALKNANPVERAAVEFGTRRGIPVDAATVTGNRAVAGTQYIADRSIPGSIVSERATQHAGTQMERVGGELAGQVHPTAVSPYQAGQAVVDDLDSVVTRLRETANTAYDDLRTIEALPANRSSRMVDGKPQTMAFPVDLRPVKQNLKSIYDRLTRTMPLTQQQASPGLVALRNIVEGPNFAPASVVEMDLGTLKSIVREADSPALRSVGQGMAANAVDELNKAVMTAVARGGPDAVKALQAGRAATKAKYAVADVLGALREEPVQIFNQATWAKDAGIDRLKQVAQIAPDQLPKIGRAYLDNLMEKATAEGGFSRGASLWSDWQKLGPQTKGLLFTDPALVSDLDNFFLLAKKMSANPNPSGTGLIVSTGAGGTLIVANPVLGLSTQATLGAMSKLLHSRAGVKLLTEGLTIPVKDPARFAGWADRFQQEVSKSAPPAKKPDESVIVMGAKR